MKKYFLYELKKNAYAILCLTLIAIVIYVIPVLTFRIINDTINYKDTQLTIISAIGGALAVIVPVWLLSYRMKKRSVDLYYALPVSRTKIFIVKLAVGLIAVFVPYTVAYWFGAAMYSAKFSSLIHPVYYIPQYFLSIPAIVCIYAIAAFAFTRANTMLDGIIFMLFWGAILGLVSYILNNLTTVYKAHSYVSYIVSDYYFPFSPLKHLTVYYMQRMTSYTNVYNFKLANIDKINMIVGFTLTGIMALGAAAGLILTEKYAKAENAGQISESRFGYKIMIPAYCALAIGTCNLDYYDLYIFAIVIVCGYLLTVLYKRTVKIGTKWAVILIASVIVGIILSAFSTI